MSRCEASEDELTYMPEFSKDIRLPLNHFIACVKLGLDHLDCEKVSGRPVEAFVNRCKRPVSKSGKSISTEPPAKTPSHTPSPYRIAPRQRFSHHAGET